LEDGVFDGRGGAEFRVETELRAGIDLRRGSLIRSFGCYLSAYRSTMKSFAAVD
jgi:hypothetical protein